MGEARGKVDLGDCEPRVAPARLSAFGIVIKETVCVHHNNGAITPGLCGNPGNGVVDINGLLY